MRTFEEDEGVFKGGGGHFEGKKRRKKKEEGILEAVPAVYRERKRGSMVGKKITEKNEEEGGSGGYLIMITFSGDISN